MDFFSIGTNDLTQYTLAADRQNDRLDDFYDPRHPAVLRLIAYVAENAQKAGIRAGICGELAADPSPYGSLSENGDPGAVGVAFLPSAPEKEDPGDLSGRNRK